MQGPAGTKPPARPGARKDEAARKSDFIEATLWCLAEHGYAGTTVRRIAARAGVAPGLLTHYYSGKEQLVGEAWRTLAGRLLEHVSLEPDDRSAAARLAHFIAASFRAPNLDPGLLRVWTGFWSLVHSDPAARSVHGETYRRYRAVLEHRLREAWIEAGRAPDASEIEDLAIGISALLDGLWLEWCLDPSTFGADRAEAIARRFAERAAGLRLPAVE